MSYIGKAPGVGVRNRYYFTATGGETSLSGTDDASNTLAFSDGKYVDVTLNGVTLVAGTDYDTATANTIDNLTALTAGDVVEVVVYDVFSIAAAVPPTGGTFSGPVIFNGELIVPRGTTAQRPASPSTGSIRFNTSASAYEGYDGTGWVYLSDVTIEVEYLVIAGGGGGGGHSGAPGYSAGGGGAGGYRSSVAGENSGGGASAESALSLATNTAYIVTVGAGGVGGADGVKENGDNGANSVFNTIISSGGGGGGGRQLTGSSGGSGGGGGAVVSSGGSGTPNQGYAGGTAANSADRSGSGGGGGASEAGSNGVSLAGGDGGDGVSSSVTGSAVTRAGGGGGGGNTAGNGGLGGGGNGGGGDNVDGSAGTANTGSGGGGGGPVNTGGGAGGSGVVILKIPAANSATFSAGVTQTSATVGAYKVYTITAAGASDTVTFS